MADDDGGGGVDWSDLPPLLITHIFKHLTLFLDYLRARFACKNWESALPLTQTLLLPQPALLMLPSIPRSPATRPFFDLHARRAHFVPVPLPDSDPDTHCFSSSHGWLFLLGRPPTLFLLNPVTRDAIRLPSLDTLPAAVLRCQPKINAEYVVRYDHPTEEEVELPRRSLIRFAVLSSNPAADPKFEVLLLLFGVRKLVFRYRTGAGNLWAPIELPEPLFSIRDIIYLRGSRTIFAVDDDNKSLLFLRLPDDTKNLSFVVIKIPEVPASAESYLVLTPKDSSLMLVTRHERSDAFSTGITNFRVFLLCDGRQIPRSINVNEIVDMASFALFVGLSRSVCIDTTVFPEYEANCIYFTREYHKIVSGYHLVGETVGRYNLQLQRVDETYDLDALGPPISLLFRELGPAMWVTPSMRKMRGGSGT